jgi:hypothetical protein
MGGGLIQLVAYGAQDAYLMGNPHITFWKVLYKRHTNFAIESARVQFTGAPSYGQRIIANISRNADLMYKTYIEVTLPDTSATANPGNLDVFWSNNSRRRLGYLLLQKVEVEIGGQVIDTQYGEWMYLWENLTSSYDNSVRLDRLLGGEMTGAVSTSTSCGGRPQVLYIPLQFWFCRNPGLALPLIALQYHEVHLNVTLGKATDLVCNNVGAVSVYGLNSVASTETYSTISAAAAVLPQLKDIAVYVDYIYLDVEERRRFASESHEYLIDQVQYNPRQTLTSGTARIDLTLNHPVKELVWVFQDDRRIDCSDPLGLGSTQPFTYDDIVNRCRLQVNGTDRFTERFGDYFWKVQPYQHHSGGAFEATRNAVVNTSDTANATDPLVFAGQNPINVYSFALKPEEHQPSGTCNFSRIDTTTLVFDSITRTSVMTGTVGSNYSASAMPVTGVTRTLTNTTASPSKTTPFSFRLYAVNYNVFRISSGMGGLAYAN